MVDSHEVQTEYVRCALCGAERWRLLFSATDRAFGVPGHYGVVRCEECGLVYTNPRPVVAALPRCYPAAEYFALSSTEPRTPDPLPSPDRQQRRLVMALLLQAGYGYQLGLRGRRLRALSGTRWLWQRVLESHPVLQIPRFVPGARLLEVGFGQGRALQRFTSLGWKVFGTDISVETCRHARFNLGLTVFQSNAGQLGVADESLDAIYLHHVFEHLANPKEVVAEFARALRRDGQLVMSLPNFACWQSRWFRQNWRGLEVPRHLYHYTKGTILRVLAGGGFKDIRVRATVANPTNVFCASLPPTEENDLPHQVAWWHSMLVAGPLHVLGPWAGLGDSLYVTARRV